MAKLYLIRRSLETYAGPMTLQDMVQAYKRLEFGLQDEVCGSCGPWIQFEDLSRLKRAYPDVAKVVAEEFLGGWGISLPDRPFAHASKKRPARNATPTILFALIFTAGCIFSFFAVKGSRLSGKFIDVKGSDATEVGALLTKGSITEFESRMAAILPTILPKATQSRKAYGEWIPYLRAYAFLRDGEIEGMNPKLLKGAEIYAAPNDCSQDAWRTYFKEGEARIKDALAGKFFHVHPAVAILLWDVSWLRRRLKNAGWVVPQSYYEGCLLMAYQAAEGLEIRERLKFQLARLYGQSSDGAEITNPVFSHISCLERASSSAALNACTVPSISALDQKNYLALMRARIDAFQLLKGKSSLVEEHAETLTKLRKALLSKDPVTSFSYQAELAYIDAILSNNGSVKEGSRRVLNEYPDVSFAE